MFTTTLVKWKSENLCPAFKSSQSGQPVPVSFIAKHQDSEYWSQSALLRLFSDTIPGVGGGFKVKIVPSDTENNCLFLFQNRITESTWIFVKFVQDKVKSKLGIENPIWKW